MSKCPKIMTRDEKIKKYRIDTEKDTHTTILNGEYDSYDIDKFIELLQTYLINFPDSRIRLDMEDDYGYRIQKLLCIHREKKSDKEIDTEIAIAEAYEKEKMVRDQREWERLCKERGVSPDKKPYIKY